MNATKITPIMRNAETDQNRGRLAGLISASFSKNQEVPGNRDLLFQEVRDSANQC